MVGAGRILKNALAVAASAACLSRSRRSRVTDQDSTATDSDSDFPSIILRNQLLSSSVASCVATAEARFLRAGKENGTFCAECTQVHEQQKAPDDAASTQKAGFDGSSRQIRDLQNLELDASALGPRAARVYGRGLLPYDKSVARHAEIAPGRVVFYLKGLPPWMMLAAKR